MTETIDHRPVHPPLSTDADALRLFILQPKVETIKVTPSKENQPEENEGYDDEGEELHPGVKKGKRGSSAENSDQDDVCGELVSSTFADKPVYECLSYTWGNQPCDKRITINGQTFLVRQNLFDALRHLRQKSPRSIWIDAICINQEDVEERNSQVSLMAFIYRRATRTVVWLGLSPKSYTPIDREVMYIQDKENSEAIMRHPYWNRLWIIQEIVLAREVHFVHGSLEFGWHEVDQLLAHSALWHELEEHIRPLVDHRDRIATDEFRLEALLDKFRGAQCSEKMDKIYGLLGMSHDAGDGEVGVDYTVGLFDLYQKMVDFHQKSQPLFTEDPFMFNIRPELDRTIRLMKFSSLIQSLFEGSVEGAAKTIDFDSRPKKYYYARGALACKILYLGPTYHQTVGSLKINNAWKKGIEKAYVSSTREELRELRLEDAAYSKGILDWDDAKLATIRNIDSSSSFGFRYTAEDDDDDVGDALNETPEPSVRDTESGLECLPGEPRRFLGTHSQVGFIPSNARIGDEVYNFLDCDVAVTVRRLGGTFSDRWKIVGKADLSCRQWKEEGRQKIDTDVLNCVLAEADAELESPQAMQEEKDLMMNFKMDIEVLQKLTC